MGGAQSDSYNLLWRVKLWHVSNGGAIAQLGFQECESGGNAMTVSPQLCFICSENLEVCNDWSWHILPRCRTSGW